MRQLLPSLHAHRGALAVGFAFMLLQNWAYSRVPLYIQRLLDEIVGSNLPGAVWRHAQLAIGFAVLTGLCTYFMRRLITGASRHIEYGLRDRLFRTLLGLPPSFFQQRKTGDIISRCTNDLSDVRTLLGPGIMYIPNALSRLALFLPALATLHVTMTIALLGVMATLILVNALVVPRFRPLFQRVQEHVGAINDLAWQTATGITTVKLYAAEQQQRDRFASRNHEYIRANMRVTRIRSLLSPLMLLVLGVMELVILWFGGSAVVAGTMSIGELLQFATMVGILTFPILSVGWVMSLLQQGLSAMERMDDILSAVPESRDGLPVPAASAAPRVALSGVGFHYQSNNSESLSAVNLELRPGEVLGLTGPVGGGKSTLVALLAGMLRPTTGTASVNGTDVAGLDLLAVRGRVAYVPQEPFLFSMSVRENIAMGSEQGVPLDQVTTAANAAAVATDIETFPDGYDQLIGERGITLSGGQKQRVAIARALLRTQRGEADLLILDDALSSVDSDTEARILKSLRALRDASASNDGISVVLVSQRTSALRTADRIAVVAGGHIVESGTHDQLSARQDGLYSRITQLQRLDAEVTR